MARPPKLKSTDTNQRKLISNVTVSPKPVEITFPPLHPKQFELVNSFNKHPEVRFVIGACGSKFGKTVSCSIWLAQHAWEHKGSLNWWVAPSYRQAENAMTIIQGLLPKGLFTPYTAKLKIVLLEPDGSEHSTIEFKSGDNPDTLRGFAVHAAVIDEAARNMPYESFVSVLTTLTQTNGKMICISTPNGKGWFFDIYRRGELREEWPEYFSLRMPTSANPFVPLKAIEDARRALPEDVFKQEFLGEFLDAGAGVFRGMERCEVAAMLPEPPQPGHNYVIGVDLGRLKDFTVLVVMDKTSRRNHVVYFDRFNKIDWTVQYFRIIQTAKTYNNAKVWIDTTGIGDPIIETIKAAGVNAEGYKIHGTAPKQQLIDRLRTGIEQAKLTWPKQIIVLHQELDIFEYDITESGVVRYSAPEGRHDDTVIALALAFWGCDVDSIPFIYKWLRIPHI